MKIFITDASSGEFYTAVFYAYRESDCVITSNTNFQLPLDCEVVQIEYEKDKYERVCNKLREVDKLAEGEIDCILRSSESSKEQAAFEYLKLIISGNKPARNMLAHPTVIRATDIIDRVKTEAHRFTGFLRFMETEQGVLYAPYAPDNDITDLITPHFTRRLKNERFVIHDTVRKYATIYDGKNWISAEVGEAQIYLSQYEKVFENLWKKYYDSVNISSREHLKQMKGYMPVRYWKFLPEKKD